jgi:lysophospholipase L1-like esterase
MDSGSQAPSDAASNGANDAMADGSGPGTDGGAVTSDSGTSDDGGPSVWVGTWSTSDQLVELNSTMNNNPPGELTNATLRQNVYVSIGGGTLRLRMSNQYGNAPVTMNSVHVAVSTGASSIDTSTDTAVSFSGSASLTLAAGASAMSDPFTFTLAPLATVAITIAFGTAPPSTMQGLTGHPGSRTTSYLQSGSMVSAATLPSAMTTAHWYYIEGIDVMAPASAGAIVTLGDSLTDGRGSDTDMNDRWPDDLNRRLQMGTATPPVAVLNAGIGGNAVVSGGLGPTAAQRFPTDVLGQSSARWLIVFEGVNDIGAAGTPTIASNLITAFGSFITQAHAQGMKAYGIPITPFGGSMYDSAGSQAARTTVNDWIRTSGQYDAVIDLESVVADPANPTNLLATYDSGDHLHLNAAGYQAMATAIQLTLFGR